MDKHTPIPWHKDMKAMYIYDAAGITVVKVFGPNDENQLRRNANANADADLIVRAVNAHDALVEALEAMLTVADRGDSPRKLDEALTWRQNDERAFTLARAALAKAKE